MIFKPHIHPVYSKLFKKNLCTFVPVSVEQASVFLSIRRILPVIILSGVILFHLMKMIPLHHFAFRFRKLLKFRPVKAYAHIFIGTHVFKLIYDIH